MDRKLEKKRGVTLMFSRKVLPYWAGALMLGVTLWALLHDNSSTFRTSRDTVTTGKAIAEAE